MLTTSASNSFIGDFQFEHIPHYLSLLDRLPFQIRNIESFIGNFGKQRCHFFHSDRLLEAKSHAFSVHLNSVFFSLELLLDCVLQPIVKFKNRNTCSFSRLHFDDINIHYHSPLHSP